MLHSATVHGNSATVHGNGYERQRRYCGFAVAVVQVYGTTARSWLSGDKSVQVRDVRSEKCSQHAACSGGNIDITYKRDVTHTWFILLSNFEFFHLPKFTYV
ncbi:hypothetical protein L1987_10580 [Smallanthus sonchifolius]|uniref:Uncharacterized protein n=1 Tax=Smallanthus sonchifolius TaxID=185202 RepID=A0ACB9JSN6_9ASTR|nr:hypothetical protein L1987_10580 [Smallanthus sonchifolius]